jgi:hypothetical protein
MFCSDINPPVRRVSGLIVIPRRGRPDSPLLDDTETAATDIGDLAAVLEHTGARRSSGTAAADSSRCKQV